MNNKDLEKKVIAIANSLIYETGYVCSVDVLMKLNFISNIDYENWRFGKIEYLEKVCNVNLGI